MRLSRIIAATLVAAALLGDAPLTATAVVPGTSGCRRLHGKDLAPARTVKLVKRRGGTELIGCSLPTGRVRTFATSDNGPFGDSYAVREVRGAFVLLTEHFDSGSLTELSTSVINIRTGRRYTVARLCAQLGGRGDCYGHATAAAASINQRGETAAAITAAPTDTGAFAATTTIVGFSSTGRRTVLDSGPSTELTASSLALHGRTVTWTHSGQARRAGLGSDVVTANV